MRDLVVYFLFVSLVYVHSVTQPKSHNCHSVRWRQAKLAPFRFPCLPQPLAAIEGGGPRSGGRSSRKRQGKLHMAQATLSCRYAAIHLVRSFRLPYQLEPADAGLRVGDGVGTFVTRFPSAVPAGAAPADRLPPLSLRGSVADVAIRISRRAASFLHMRKIQSGQEELRIATPVLRHWFAMTGGEPGCAAFAFPQNSRLRSELPDRFARPARTWGGPPGSPWPDPCAKQ